MPDLDSLGDLRCARATSRTRRVRIVRCDAAREQSDKKQPDRRGHPRATCPTKYVRKHLDLPPRHSAERAKFEGHMVTNLRPFIVPDGGGLALRELVRGRPGRVQAREHRAGRLGDARREGTLSVPRETSNDRYRFWDASMARASITMELALLAGLADGRDCA